MDRASDVKRWLETALSEEHLEDLSFEIAGNANSGFIGDVTFIVVNGIDKKGVHKQYSLVLKCNKTDKALTEKFGVFQTAFVREIFVYKEILPFFKEFQLRKGIENPFDSVAKCYGTYSDETRHIVVFEDLRESGYHLYDNRHPLTIQHVKLVVKEYAKFHSISVAVREQEPEQFQKFVDSTSFDILRDFFRNAGFLTLIKNTVKETHDMMKNDLDTEMLTKWLAFKDQIDFIVFEMDPNENDLRVITHGDCWNNNFMYKYEDNGQRSVSKVAILDWQITRFSSPIMDLSYFLFSCIAGHDVAELDTILRDYYDTFCGFLKQLGSNFVEKYSFETFFEEWRKYAKFGLSASILPMKFSYSVETPDMAKTAKEGKDISTAFQFSVKNTALYKARLKPIVEYACKTGLI